MSAAAFVVAGPLPNDKAPISAKVWQGLQARAVLRGLQLRRSPHGLTLVDTLGRTRRIASLDDLEALANRLGGAS